MAAIAGPTLDPYLANAPGGHRDSYEDDNRRLGFRPSFDREDDENELVKAVLAEMPSRLAARTAVLPADAMQEGESIEGGKFVQVDLKKLKRKQRKELVEKALATTDQENERFLKHLRERINRVGIKPPSAEVRYEDLNIEADVYVGSRALPTLPNSFRNALEAGLAFLKINRGAKRNFPILQNVHGVLKPGRLTLLLGPPGSGKTTLMLALAGKLYSELRQTGAITYNGESMDKFVPQCTAAYISQVDSLLGELTVRETLDFAARVQGVGGKAEMVRELVRREKEQGIVPDPEIDAYFKASAVEAKRHSVVTDYMMKILGLETSAETCVGNDMHRGISGGQKKRTTTGEMVVGPKKVLFMDEISTGLDSSTTFQIVKCTGNFVHLLDATVLMSLLQPAPETFRLFDDVVFLSEGHVCFHGPIDEVVPFFESFGFKCPARKGAADFLQEITSRKDQEQYWADSSRPYHYIPVKDFSEAFWKSERGTTMKAELATPANFGPEGREALVRHRYALGFWDMFRACCYRELILMKRTRFIYIFRSVQTVIVGLIFSTLFFRTTLGTSTINQANYYLGALFFSIIFMLFTGFSEMAITVDRLPVFYKQRDNLFYPAWAFTLPVSVLRIPWSLWEALLWSCIIYWVVGFAPYAGVFFKFIFILFLMNSMSIALFRLVGAVGRTQTVTQTCGSGVILVLFLLGGFVLSRSSIPPWWIWGFWCNPLAYIQNGIGVNEFLTKRWNTPYAGDPTLTIGQAVLQQRGLFTDGNYYWWAVIVLIGYYVIFNILIILALAYFPAMGKPQAVMTEEDLAQKAAARAGKEHELENVNSGIKVQKSQTKKLDRSLVSGNEVIMADRVAKLRAEEGVLGLAPRAVPAGSPEVHGALSGDFGNQGGPGFSHVSEAEAGGNDHYGANGHQPSEAEKTFTGEPMGITSAQGPSGGKGPKGTWEESYGLESARDGDVQKGPIERGDPSGASALHSTPEERERERKKMRVAQSSLGAEAAARGGQVAEKGMVLPFKPLPMTFLNVWYYVDLPPGADPDESSPKAGKLPLLRNVSGAFRPGVLTALVGVSGAGKTTLMDVLSGRKTGGIIEGDINVGGYPKEQQTFARISGYCEQTDVHAPQTTVREALVFSAWLRLPKDVDKHTREMFVDEVMELVELTGLRNALVGLPGMSGLSVEQRKRLTIAVELVANPSIIFMDEPTSGLDARAAAIVMRAVRNTVDTGRTVVCTIHQPSIDIFEAFDELLLMKQGGKLIYHGPLGHESNELVEYFQSIQGVPKITTGYNPATWMLEISTRGMEERLGIDYAEHFEKSDLFQHNEKLIAELSQPKDGTERLHFDTRYARSPFIQTGALLWRANKTYWRSPTYNSVRFLFTTAVALIFGSVFYKLGNKRDTQATVFNIAGALYAAVLFLGISNASSIQPVISTERAVSYRERAAGMYSGMPFITALGIIEIPYVTVQTIVYAALTYSMINFEWTPAKFFWYLFFMWLTLLYFAYYGLMAVAITPSLQLAAVASSAFYALFNLFAGFIIPQPQIPGWWVWYYWINPVAWTLYGLVASQLGDVTTPITSPGYTGSVTVKQFLEDYFGFKHNFLGICVAVLCGFVAMFWIVAALGVKYLNFQKR